MRIIRVPAIIPPVTEAPAPAPREPEVPWDRVADQIHQEIERASKDLREWVESHRPPTPTGPEPTEPKIPWDKITDQIHQEIEQASQSLKEQLSAAKGSDPTEQPSASLCQTPELELFRADWEKRLAALGGGEPSTAIPAWPENFSEIQKAVQDLESNTAESAEGSDPTEQPSASLCQSPVSDDQPTGEAPPENLLPDFDLSVPTAASPARSFFSWLKGYLNEPVIEFGRRELPPDTNKAA